MIVNCVHIAVEPGRIEDFIQATIKNHEGTRQEPGNLRFDVLQNANDPSLFLLYEVFESEAAIEEHRKTSHYLAWREAVAGWMARPREAVSHRVIAPVDRARW